MFKSATSNSTSAKSSNPSSPFRKENGNNDFIQPKLNIGKSNDKYEVEADRTADKIVEKKQNKNQDTFFAPSPLVQKKLANDIQKQEENNKEIQQKPLIETITPVVQLKQEKEEIVQNKLDPPKKEESKTSEIFAAPKALIQNKPEEEIQKQTEKDKEIQQKPLVETITPVVQLKQENEEIVQNKLDTAKKEESKTNENFTSSKALIQNKPEEEIQKQVEKTNEVQQKNTAETSLQEIQPKNEILQKKPEPLKKESNIPPKVPLVSKPIIQTKPEEEVQQKKEEETQGKEEEQSLQMSAAGDATPNNNNLESNLNSSRGGGSPLPQNTKTEMESGFGADFSNVRVHNDSNAVQMNKQLGSQAFATGNDIYFNEGKFNPASQSGKHLLAHELTHTVQQGASVRMKPEITPAPEMIQGSFLDLVPDWIIDQARHIPGYTLFTVIIAYDPLRQVDVERSPINLIEGLMGLVPFGTAIFDKLQEYGILQQVFDWVEGKLSELGLTVDGILDLVEQVWDEVSFPYTDIIDLVTEKFNEVVSRITSFVSSTVDQVITWIKEALIGVAEPLLAENKAWALIKKIIKYDPLRDETVNATTVEILEDFLILIDKQTELDQMKEKGTLQKTADWLDTQVGTFTSLLGELRGLITAAWDAIQPANLPNITDNLAALATQAGGFLQRVWDFASGVALKVLELVKDSLLGWLSQQASGIRGYSLIKVIIGKDPFTQEVVPRTVPNLIRGFMSLMEGGEEQYAQMEQSGAIARIVGEIEAAVATLNMTPQSIVQMFTDIWDSMTIDDLIHPLDAFMRIIDKFGEPIGRLIAFVAEIVRIVIVAILEIMNFPFDLIGNIITRAMEAIEDIKKDPIGFLKNILRAIKQGFIQFFDNIVTHLIGGVTGWLMSELRDANVPVLSDFSLQGVISWVLEVLGISMERIWEKLAAHPRIGPERVARIRGMINTLEGIWTFIKDVQERGMAAIWDKIQEQLSNLWNTVLDAVKNFVMERIITQITARLLSMLDPTGIMAVINGAVAFYSAIQSFIRYLREMLEIVNSFVSGVADLARGNVATAANYLERTMGQAMPVVIGFLANQVGLSGIGRRVGEMIVSVREMVDQALTWLVNRAVDRGMALLDRIMGRGEPEAAVTPSGPIAGALAEIHTEGEKEKDQGVVTPDEAQAIKVKVNRDHEAVIDISSVADGGATWDFNYVQKAKEEIPKSTPTPPPAVIPSFQNSVLAQSFRAEYISSDQPNQTPLGEDARLNNGQTLKGWTNLQTAIVAGGKTVKDKAGKEIKVDASVREIGNYVKMHLLHDGLGGPAKDSNLVPAKSGVNTDFWNEMEKFAVADINSAEKKVLWYEVNVTFHPESPPDALKSDDGTTVDYSGYPKSVNAKFGYMIYNAETNAWDPGPQNPNVFSNNNIEIPDFGRAENRRFNPNIDGWPNLMAMEDFESDEGYHLTIQMARFINNERTQNGNFSSYSGSDSNSFITRMNRRKNGSGIGRPPSVPSDFDRAMRLIASLDQKGRFII